MFEELCILADEDEDCIDEVFIAQSVEDLRKISLKNKKEIIDKFFEIFEKNQQLEKLLVFFEHFYSSNNKSPL